MNNMLAVPFVAGSIVWMVSSYAILINTTELSQFACIAISAGITVGVDAVTLFLMAKFGKKESKTE